MMYIFWACRMQDSWSPLGLARFSLCPKRDVTYKAVTSEKNLVFDRLEIHLCGCVDCRM
jgi:hypothetical protein